MAEISVELINPTNNQNIYVGVPEEMVLRDVFAQLVEEGFLRRGRYAGRLKRAGEPTGQRKESVQLDNNKTIAENGVSHNDTIQILNGTKA